MTNPDPTPAERQAQRDQRLGALILGVIVALVSAKAYWLSVALLLGAAALGVLAWRWVNVRGWLLGGTAVLLLLSAGNIPLVQHRQAQAAQQAALLAEQQRQAEQARQEAEQRAAEQRAEEERQAKQRAEQARAAEAKKVNNRWTTWWRDALKPDPAAEQRDRQREAADAERQRVRAAQRAREQAATARLQAQQQAEDAASDAFEARCLQAIQAQVGERVIPVSGGMLSPRRWITGSPSWFWKPMIRVVRTLDETPYTCRTSNAGFEILEGW